MKLVDQHGRPFKEARPTRDIIALRRKIIHHLKNRYDAAQDNSQNEMHWAQADMLSPNSSNQIAVRKKLRSRSRYEVANNGYLKGILLTLCQDFVGRGPTLQITDQRFDDEQRDIIERRWRERAKKIKLRKNLWRLRHAKCQDGEGFALRINNEQLKHPIKSQYRLYESDQVTSFEAPDLRNPRSEVDGIRFSRRTGDPTHYHLLNEHPGEHLIQNLRPLEGRWIAAENFIHWFRQDRGWLRGIPETTPTLPLWALLRRYTLAVVQNAEIAADFTVLLKSLQPASTNQFMLDGNGNPTQTDPEDWFDSFPVDRGMMSVLPDQYDLEQLDPTQPVSTYDSFVLALIQEAARPLLVPRNFAVGYSGESNMASGNLDKQIYRDAISDERNDCNDEVLDPDLEDWWQEAIRVPGYFADENLSENPITRIVANFQDLRENPPEHTYRWDEKPEHVDPVKVAQAIDILWRGGHLSDADIQEKRFNRPLEEHYTNLERQNKRRGDLDMVLPSQEPVEIPPGNEGGSNEE